MCKRKFSHFAAQKPRRGKRDPNAANRYDMDVTFEELVAAGGDLEDIESEICRLTNDLHPMFDREDICVCKHADKQYCYMPRMVAELEKAEGKLEGSINPTWKHPLENVMLRSAMQLASRMITHKDTLPFWASIFAHGDDTTRDRDAYNRIHVRSRNHLSCAAEKAVLDRLSQAAKLMRFHFKLFEDRDYLNHAPEDPAIAGFCAILRAEEEEATWENLPEDGCLYYAFKDGKPTVDIEDPAFIHLWLNLRRIKSHDVLPENYTISQIRAAIVEAARTICHELAHALVMSYVGFNAPYINDESIIENGCSLEYFLFGGQIGFSDDEKHPIVVVPWPNLAR